MWIERIGGSFVQDLSDSIRGKRQPEFWEWRGAPDKSLLVLAKAVAVAKSHIFAYVIIRVKMKEVL